MGSFQEDFYLQSSSPLARVWRNARLFVYVMQVAWIWSVSGSRVRRAIRRARRSGEPYVIDRLGK